MIFQQLFQESRFVVFEDKVTFFILEQRVSVNVLELCEEADFEALNCEPSTNVDTKQNAQLTTETAFLPNACYKLAFFFRP
jgi:hypothetical protein